MKILSNNSPEVQQSRVSNKPLDFDRRIYPDKQHSDGKHAPFFGDQMEKVPDYGITLGRLQKKIVQLN